MICGHAHASRGGRWRSSPTGAGSSRAPGDAAAVRRHHLHRERREGRVLHRDRQPRADPAALRPGRERLHGRARGGALRDHPGRGALRRGDGHRDGAEDRAHRQPRLGRRLLRDGGAGLRSRLHPLLADRTDGRHGRRVGGRARCTVPSSRRRSRPGAEPSAAVQASMDAMRADYEHQLDARYAAARGYVDAIITPEETRDQLAFLLRHRRQLRAGRTLVPSSFPRSTRYPSADAHLPDPAASAAALPRLRGPLRYSRRAQRRSRPRTCPTSRPRLPPRRSVRNRRRRWRPPTLAFAQGWMPLRGRPACPASASAPDLGRSRRAHRHPRQRDRRGGAGAAAHPHRAAQAPRPPRLLGRGRGAAQAARPGRLDPDRRPCSAA